MKESNLNKRLNNFLNKVCKKYNGYYSYPYIQSEYTGSNSIITICCPKHGFFQQRARKHVEGILPCPECVKDKNRSKTDYKTFSWFLNNARKVHGDKYEYDESSYSKNQDTKIKIYCPIHGWYEQIEKVHLKGHGCPACSNCKQHTTESFILKAKKIHGDKYNYDKTTYGKNNRDFVTITCPKHGDFIQTPHNHLSGYGCSKCKLKEQTNIFNMIKSWFPNEQWEWEYSPEWLGLQRFDIYNIKYNIAIEFNGRQHYEPIACMGGDRQFEINKLRDCKKSELCDINNCILYCIKYDNKNYDKIREDINNIINDKNHEN